MQPMFIEELLRLFFQQCSNDPSLFVSNFDRSETMIGFNFNCDEHRFTHVSTSFKSILGYNQNNILLNGNFTSKIVHPQDQKVIIECLRRVDFSNRQSIPISNPDRFERFKFRAKHMRGYWKYFIAYTISYIRSGSSSDNIGLILDERISDQSDKKKKNELDDGFWKYRNSTRQFSSIITEHVSPREYEILEMISNGMVTKEIAAHLHISNSTVITHRKNLLSKLQVRNTAQLIKKASKHMLI